MSDTPTPRKTLAQLVAESKAHIEQSEKITLKLADLNRQIEERFEEILASPSEADELPSVVPEVPLLAEKIGRHCE